SSWANRRSRQAAYPRAPPTALRARVACAPRSSWGDGRCRETHRVGGRRVCGTHLLGQETRSQRAAPRAAVALAAGDLHRIPAPLELSLESIAKLALDLDHPVAQRAARAARAFELLRERFERVRRSAQPGDQRDRLAPARLAIAQQAHHAIPRQ